MNEDLTFVRDRLEITNLLHSYAHHADSGAADAFLGLFAEDARVDIGNPEVVDKAGLRRLMAQRSAVAGEAPAQRRHVMSNLVFHDQGASRARGALYFTLMSTDGGRVAPVMTGQYQFTVSRQDGGWRISDWKAVMDAAPP